ncbi:MAG TPA: putative toxin-antitoxin system toxin component, PIN family [Pyrinomonadaceae bacterium]|nr:putative toxin-antitoxin system toxin component, PIN family [Pyrinomonadaceae bacterium]
MRIVLDTNVLLVAFIARGFCHQLLEYCVRNHDLVTSEFILGEVREKLIEKFKHTPEIGDEVVRLLRSRMEVVTPAPLGEPVCRDADDNNVLAAAAAGNCDCLITGDKDLLVLKSFQDIAIISPSDFQSYEKPGEA